MALTTIAKMNNFQLAQPQLPQTSIQPSPEQIMGGHKALNATIDGLVKLVSKPGGQLTKKDVFDEVSTMIAHGAFPTPESKQQLIGELANLPDEESDIRKILGSQLLNLVQFQNHYRQTFGMEQQ